MFDSHQKHRQVIAELSSLLNSGIPLLQGLETLANIYPTLHSLVHALHQYISEGSTLSLAMQYCDFEPLALQLVATGEKTGQLALLLTQLKTLQSNTERLKKSLQKALFYPACILLFTIILFGVMLVLVLPKFFIFYKTMGHSLPAFTLFFLQLSTAATRLDTWFILFALGGLLYRFRRKIPLDRLPFLGSIKKTKEHAQLFRHCGVCVLAGIPLLSALTHILETVQSPRLQSYLNYWIHSLEQGEFFSTALYRTPIPASIPARVALAEVNGTLGLALEQLALQFEEQLEALLAKLLQYIEPILMIVLGFGVGSLIIALYLPIFYLGQGLR